MKHTIDPETEIELASQFSKWAEYVDPSGMISEEEFDSLSMQQKIELIRACNFEN